MSESHHVDPVESEPLLDVHEAAELLDVSEKELWDLVHRHQVPTHNIAGAFLRFRKEDIEQLKIKWRIHRELFPEKRDSFAHDETVTPPTFSEILADFWYFNDFYIICTALILALLAFIIISQ